MQSLLKASGSLIGSIESLCTTIAAEEAAAKTTETTIPELPAPVAPSLAETLAIEA